MSESKAPTGIQCILLDRDGVINQDSPDYIKSADEWQPIPGAIAAIAKLQQSFKVAICTNQSGVGRGLYSEATLADIHNKLINTLHEHGGKPLPIFFCPHLPDAGCDCRKPEPGLLNAGMKALQGSPLTTVYVGDSTKDLQAAAAAGCHAALVMTGNGRTTAEKLSSMAADTSPVHTFIDLGELADTFCA